MLFDKQTVIDHIAQQVGPDRAQQASQMLPDQVDHEQHGSMLQSLGIDPQNMANQLGPQSASRTGQQGGYGDPGSQGGYGDQGQQGQQGGYGDQGRQGGYGDQGREGGYGDRDDEERGRI